MEKPTPGQLENLEYALTDAIDRIADVLIVMAAHKRKSRKLRLGPVVADLADSLRAIQATVASGYYECELDHALLYDTGIGLGTIYERWGGEVAFWDGWEALWSTEGMRAAVRVLEGFDPFRHDPWREAVNLARVQAGTQREAHRCRREARYDPKEPFVAHRVGKEA